jgi:hypothetical protein
MIKKKFCWPLFLFFQKDGFGFVPEYNPRSSTMYSLSGRSICVGNARIPSCYDFSLDLLSPRIVSEKIRHYTNRRYYKYLPNQNRTTYTSIIRILLLSGDRATIKVVVRVNKSPSSPVAILCLYEYSHDWYRFRELFRRCLFHIIYILSNMTNNNWLICILCYCKSNIDTGQRIHGRRSRIILGNETKTILLWLFTRFVYTRGSSQKRSAIIQILTKPKYNNIYICH